MKKNYYIVFCLLFLNFCTFGEVLPISTAEFPPFKYVDKKTGDIVGFDTEIIKEVFSIMGIDIEIKVLPFVTADSATRGGRYAAYYTFTKNLDREKEYYFSETISVVQDIIFKRKDQNITWSEYEDLEEYKLGYSKKYNYDKEFMSAIKNKEGISGNKTEERLFRMLSKGRIDILICEASVGNFILKENKEEFKNIDFINKPVGSSKPRPFYVGFSKKWPNSKKIRDDFNEALKKFVTREDNPRKKIMQKYGASYTELLENQFK